MVITTYFNPKIQQDASSCPEEVALLVSMCWDILRIFSQDNLEAVSGVCCWLEGDIKVRLLTIKENGGRNLEGQGQAAQFQYGTAHMILWSTSIGHQVGVHHLLIEIHKKTTVQNLFIYLYIYPFIYLFTIWKKKMLVRKIWCSDQQREEGNIRWSINM